MYVPVRETERKLVRSPFLLIEAATVEKEVSDGKWRVNRQKLPGTSGREGALLYLAPKPMILFFFSSRKSDSIFVPVAMEPTKQTGSFDSIDQPKPKVPILTIPNHYYK